MCGLTCPAVQNIGEEVEREEGPNESAAQRPGQVRGPRAPSPLAVPAKPVHQPPFGGGGPSPRVAVESLPLQQPQPGAPAAPWAMTTAFPTPVVTEPPSSPTSPLLSPPLADGSSRFIEPRIRKKGRLVPTASRSFHVLSSQSQQQQQQQGSAGASPCLSPGTPQQSQPPPSSSGGASAKSLIPSAAHSYTAAAATAALEPRTSAAVAPLMMRRDSSLRSSASAMRKGLSVSFCGAAAAQPSGSPTAVPGPTIGE